MRSTLWGAALLASSGLLGATGATANYPATQSPSPHHNQYPHHDPQPHPHRHKQPYQDEESGQANGLWDDEAGPSGRARRHLALLQSGYPMDTMEGPMEGVFYPQYHGQQPHGGKYQASDTGNPFQQHKNKSPVHVAINPGLASRLIVILVLAMLSVLGCMGSVFLISAMTVIEALQTRGNIYLVSLSLGYLGVPLLITPSAALQMMSGDGISGHTVCHHHWLLFQFSLIVTHMSYLMIAADNFLGYHSPIIQTTTTTTTITSSINTNNNTSTTFNTSTRTAINGPPSSGSVTAGGTGAGTALATATSNSAASAASTSHPAAGNIAAGGPPPTGGPAALPAANNQAGQPIKTSSSMAVAHREATSNHHERQATTSTTTAYKNSYLCNCYCLHYDWCCSLGRILVFICAIWAFSILIVVEQHRLNYGPNYCLRVPHNGTTPLLNGTVPQNGTTALGDGTALNGTAATGRNRKAIARWDDPWLEVPPDTYIDSKKRIAGSPRSKRLGPKGGRSNRVPNQTNQPQQEPGNETRPLRRAGNGSSTEEQRYLDEQDSHLWFEYHLSLIVGAYIVPNLLTVFFFGAAFIKMRRLTKAPSPGPIKTATHTSPMASSLVMSGLEVSAPLKHHPTPLEAVVPSSVRAGHVHPSPEVGGPTTVLKPPPRPNMKGSPSSSVAGDASDPGTKPPTANAPLRQQPSFSAPASATLPGDPVGPAVPDLVQQHGQQSGANPVWHGPDQRQGQRQTQVGQHDNQEEQQEAQDEHQRQRQMQMLRLERHRSLPRSSRLYRDPVGAAPADYYDEEEHARPQTAAFTRDPRSAHYQYPPAGSPYMEPGGQLGVGGQPHLHHQQLSQQHLAQQQQAQLQQTQPQQQQLAKMPGAGRRPYQEAPMGGSAHADHEPPVGQHQTVATFCTYANMCDEQLLKANMYAYLFSFIMWLPLIVLSCIISQREVAQFWYDLVWYSSVINCCFYSYVYAWKSLNFREGFNKLFFYFWCKAHVTFQRKGTTMRRQLELDDQGNLRIHIIPGLYGNRGQKEASIGASAGASLGGHGGATGSGTGGPGPFSGEGGSGQGTSGGSRFGGPLFSLMASHNSRWQTTDSSHGHSQGGHAHQGGGGGFGGLSGHAYSSGAEGHHGHHGSAGRSHRSGAFGTSGHTVSHSIFGGHRSYGNHSGSGGTASGHGHTAHYSSGVASSSTGGAHYRSGGRTHHHSLAGHHGRQTSEL